ncbi:siderophore ferric iron reductase [Devosia sp. YIM 151766]|uniref:siderophore ferric iron reductase n=1 Tax=Devosia sp. YIM 151766 TaxID=3017325 RepID=UPI00255CCBE4|nr:siderophore ferric iron reductase [Devosia sp. YIM 151766]WIY52904.1 siderophore ferric iron reductase [Devosia sp. YIM 151766]
MSARNYLFAQTDNDAALTRLIATVAKATGFMKGAPGRTPPGWHRLGQDNRAFLDTLYARLEASYPQAGQPFYAVRLWTNLTWQPAYLAVIAVHLHGALPEVSQLSQALHNIYVDDYRLEPGPQYRADIEAMIARAGPELRAHADAVFAEINALTKLKRVPALQLLAERMLTLMVRLQHFKPQTSLAEQQYFCGLWLEAMGLTGQGGLETIELPDGRQTAIVARKGCCLDYLATPGSYCASCPKQKKPVRIARQRDNAWAELEMLEGESGSA